MTDGPHELERFEAAGDVDGPEAAAWIRSAVDLQIACGALLAMGLAVRVSAVGYGRALRLSVTDSRGWSTGWTLGSAEELWALLRGLLAPGAEQYIERRLEKPSRRR